MGGKTPEELARDFLRVAHLYRLGILPTEQPHPRTAGLSRWALHDLPRAVEVLKSIDVGALETLHGHAGHIDRLAAAMQATLTAGRRIFLCGCGATGRLSLSLEFLWRQENGNGVSGNGHRDQVRAFMAGGDVALVHALEGFEDHPAYGARHLEQMGFTDGDLLISCTEGGETPYVIGATERAAELSSNAPYFLYCNADSILTAHIERFQRVYENKGVNTICLDVGPMALAGSTRMQASTVLQLAVGAALLHPQESAGALIEAYTGHIADTDFSFLTDFIATEADIYATGQHLTYRVRDYGITVLTDTTERAPTFSLVPFDQLKERLPVHSLCYVSLDNATDPEDAWSRLLNRTPHSLNWPDVDPRTTPQYLQGFDFSAGAPAQRRRQIPDRRHHEFRIRRSGNRMELRLQGLTHTLPVNGLPDLHQHLLLKQILNIHSTLVMGRLGRYESNLMTWVSPTNGKLVDRAVRYVQHLLANAGQADRTYESIVRRLFAEMEASEPGESVVLRTYRSLLRHPRDWTLA
ncbi:MAG: SIS domain-containing protein [Acidobacteria bacterium]|nr:SIS domain-containing protein [Acidobacteriota bacterium]